MIKEQRILIYFDELVMSLTKAYGSTMDTHIYSPRDLLSCMQGIRPVDAVEVVHGRWIELPSMEPDYKCSECGRSYAWWEPSEAHYCPFCGARMDLSVEVDHESS